MKTLTVKIPEDMDAKLSLIAKQQGESKSVLVRMAIEQIVESNGAKNEHAALDQIADLVGCVDGPEDLSHNKDHLKGYGQ